jgi:hypothetical protein
MLRSSNFNIIWECYFGHVIAFASVPLSSSAEILVGYDLYD